MTTTNTTLDSKYIYAVVREKDARAICETGLTGLHDVEIESDNLAGLAVISSPIGSGVIRPQRKLLAAHQRVVAEIAKHWDMLPVSFGLIAEDDLELEGIIDSNTDQLADALDRVSGKVEMNLVLSWTAADIFQYLVAKHPELQEARDMIASGQASREEMIEIGRTVESVLKSSRESHLQTLLDGLRNICSQLDQQDLKQDQEIARLNCLIDRDGEPKFEEALNKIAAKFNDEYAFSYNGPWPPYSFVNLKLSAG